MLTPFDPEQGRAILEPGGVGPGHWVGAPTVVWDESRERILLSYRKRRPRGGDPPDRGHECCIAESADGIRFDDLWRVTKDELETTSMERFGLHRDRDGRYLLYLSYEHPEDGRWRIEVVEAKSPDAFDVRTRRGVLTPAGTGTDAVKDPYVRRVGDEYWMFVSTFLTAAGPAPTWLARSDDGLTFRWDRELLPVGASWDRYQARLSSIAPAGDEWLGFYDGAGAPAEDTEERLGLAVSSDLLDWRRVSANEPWLASPHASGSLRYLDALELEGELWLYYEYARPDSAHELRLNRIPEQA